MDESPYKNIEYANEFPCPERLQESIKRGLDYYGELGGRALWPDSGDLLV